MLRHDADPPKFNRGSLVPIATYLLVIAVLVVLVAVSPGASPPPILGMAWGVFLVALTGVAFKTDGVSPQSVLPSVRTLGPVVVVLVAFWALYNLVASGLALSGVPGFEATGSRVAAHPGLYLVALLSSLLFTAIPEELVFRAYLQQKCIALAGGNSRRAVATGIGIVAVLFALFHLPRWFLASGHGVGAALAARLLGLVLMGLAYGTVYAVTGNLWLVALLHATMNQPPVLVSMSVPSELHLLVGGIEYAAVVAVVVLAVRVTQPDRTRSLWSQRETAAVTGE